MTLRLDGYIRVSRVGGRAGEGYISPEVQREAVASYASEIGGQIVAWHSDEDYSGGNTDRPGFQAVLKRLEAGATDGVVVMRIDRFARSVADGSTIVRQIVDRGQVFASCHERIDPRTPEGKYMLNSFLNNGELFLDQVKASWWTSKGKAVARGAHIGPTPIGYRRVPKGQPKSGTLTPDPVYGPAIGEVFRRAAVGEYGDSALAAWMTERAERESGRPWQPSEIRRWLANRVYRGEVRYGDLVNTDAHDPVVDEDTWQRCQREPGTQRRGSRTFVLAGVARCAHCRYSMAGQSHGGARADTPVYRCNNRHCPERSVIVAHRLEAFVDTEVRTGLRGMVAESVEGQELEGLERTVREAEAELQAFASDLQARQVLGDAGWRQGLTLRAEARDEAARARGAALQQNERLALAVSVDDHELRDLLPAVAFVFVRRRRGAPVEDRALVVWTDDRATIDVPGPHRTGQFEPVGW